MVKFAYKDNKPLKDRLTESERMKVRFPGRIPIVLQRATTSQLQMFDKEKFIVRLDQTISEFTRYLIENKGLD
jgi:GABA(A) receptor-associated protein